MPYIEVSSFKKQEVNDKVSAKKETRKINQKAKESEPVKPKKLNPFKDLKFEKVKPKDELTNLKQEVEMTKYIEEEKKQLVEKTRASDEGVLFDKHINSVLSMPHQDPIKRELFARRLKNNTAIQKYIDENIVYNVVNRVDRNIRFALHYALEYKETDREYNLLVANLQRQNHRTEPTPSKVEEIKEEPKQEMVEEQSDDLIKKEEAV